MEPPGIDLIVPATYDIIWSAIALAILVLFVVAFIKWTRVDFSGGSSAPLWLLVMAVVPIIGPIAFLIQSRNSPKRVKAPQPQ